MRGSDSQSASVQSYGGSVEVDSFTASSYDSIIHDIETYSGEPKEPSRPVDRTPSVHPADNTAGAESRPVTEPLVMETGTSGRGKPPLAAFMDRDWLADLPVDSTPLASTRRIFLSSEGLRQHTSLLTHGEGLGRSCTIQYQAIAW